VFAFYFQGTVKTISSDLLQVHDPDTPSSELVYNVLSVSVGGKNGQSQVQLNRNPVKKATSFSQKDVDEGVVVFNHSGEAGSGRIALQVSDGIEAGAPSLLRVVAFALQLRLVNNTGEISIS
jgi:Cadherin-like